jgi:RHS repeat-associated protein
MQVPNRFGSIEDYRYGFNGMEKDDEIKGEGNSYDFGARMLDPRVGRWFAPDAFEKKFPMNSPYCFVGNMPIVAIDPDGNDIVIIGSPEYRKKVLQSIKNLTKTKVGALQVYLAIKSKSTLVIYEPLEKEKLQINNFENLGNDSGYETLPFDFDVANSSHIENGEIVENTAETSLIHELGHFNTKEGQDGSLTKDGKITTYVGEEVPATEIENIYRDAIGMNPRTHYGTKKEDAVKTFGKKLGKKDPNGNYGTVNKKDYGKIKDKDLVSSGFKYSIKIEDKANYRRSAKNIKVKGDEKKQIRLTNAKKT